MSGLAAVYHRDGRPIDARTLEAMLGTISYRGPDGNAIATFGSVGLGHATFVVTPEDRLERQPLVSAWTGCVLIADARLDNREELLARLPNRSSGAIGDGEIILRAYEAWGLDVAAHLLGDFAWIIWDPKRRRLVCSRDSSGQRSLFYRVDQQTFAATSEIHQLLQDPATRVAADEERIRDFLVPLNVFRNEKDSASTFYEGIFAIPAGHTLVVDERTVCIQRDWNLSPPLELRYRDDREYAEHYRALFFEVVRSRLRSAFPVGVLLSGGLDSASIACTAAELSRTGQTEALGLVSLSFDFGGLDCDERSLIQDVQARYGFEARFVAAGTFEGRLQLEPRGFLEAPNVGVRTSRDHVLGEATSAGVRALLTGDVADSCVSGSWLVFDSLLRHGKLREFWRYLRAFHRVSPDPLWKVIVFGCAGPLLPLGLQRRLSMAYACRDVQRVWPRLLPSWMPRPLREDLANRHLELCLDAERARRFSNPTREQEFRLLYPPEVARHPSPWGIQIWRPFADRRLHQFLLAIPPEQKFAPATDPTNFYAGSKRLVRRAMKGILPESIRTRTTKTVFNAVVANEIRCQWPLYETAFGPAAHPEVAQRGYIDQGKFWERLQRLRDDPSGDDLIYVLQIIGLETWLRGLKLDRPRLVTVAPPLGGQVSRGIVRGRVQQTATAGVGD